MMIFVPLSRKQATELRDAAQRSTESVGAEQRAGWVGHTTTRAMMSSHEYDASQLEDAEYAALCYAGVRALTVADDRLRLVVAVDVPDNEIRSGADDPYGEVRADRLRWQGVTALFADEATAARSVSAARSAMDSGTTLGQALEVPAVETLLDEHDLLWFAPEELDALPA
ncbi:MAG: hypothetical protein QOF52_2255 [Propionibacteriaceae bacterium]|jgi:hypothetical protein|nr:hypothetical protein [Propionibacteriaceae bacterium]MDX6322397.1 hypothetical protein [Propionibacteriaceae bacterium]